MYEAEHAVDEGELNLRAKDILTSLSEESTDYKICFSGLVQVFHYWSTRASHASRRPAGQWACDDLLCPLVLAAALDLPGALAL